MRASLGKRITAQMTRTPAHIFVLGALLHVAGARLASSWGFPGQDISPLWPAVGFVVGLALIAGKHWWVAVVGGAVGEIANIAIFHSDTTMRFAAVVVTAQVIQNAIAGYVGQHVVRPPESSRRAIRTIRLIMVGTVLASLVGSVYLAVLGGFDEKFEAGRSWFIAGGLGYLVGAPAIVALTVDRIASERRRLSIIELLVSVSVVVAITVVGFDMEAPLASLAIPGVAWLAVRFGASASAPTVLFVACWATWRTSQGLGPFIAIDDPFVTTQYFTTALAMAGIFVAAQATQSDRQHRRLAGLVRALPDAIFVIDADGTVVEDYTESPRGTGALVGSNVTELATPDTRQQLDRARAVLAASGRSVATAKRISRSNGEPFWYETKMVRISEDRALAVARDVSDRRRADDEIRAQSERWRELMNASFQGLAEITADGIVDAANSRFASTFGLQTGDVLRRHVNDLIHESFWPSWADDYDTLRTGKRISQHIDRDNRTAVLAFLPQVDSAGSFTGAIAISLDTT